MKKKIIGVALLATVVISAAAWNFNQGKNEMKLNDIALANVEALAQAEGLPGYANVEMSWQGGMGGFMQKVCTGSGRKIC